MQTAFLALYMILLPTSDHIVPTSVCFHSRPTIASSLTFICWTTIIEWRKADTDQFLKIIIIYRCCWFLDLDMFFVKTSRCQTPVLHSCDQLDTSTLTLWPFLRENLSHEFLEHDQNSSDKKENLCHLSEESKNSGENLETIENSHLSAVHQLVPRSHSPVRYYINKAFLTYYPCCLSSFSNKPPLFHSGMVFRQDVYSKHFCYSPGYTFIFGTTLKVKWAVYEKKNNFQKQQNL